MSKSYGNAINISMTAEETAKRIKKSQTDSERMITFDPENRPGVSGLLSTAAICTGRSEVEIAEEIGMGGSGQLKKCVTEAVNEHFAPIRARREELVQDMTTSRTSCTRATAALTRSPRPRSPRCARPWAWCTSMYRLVASDMDETFLDSNHAIPEANIRALKRMKELGVLLVPSSGRWYS